jgi:hypothetical protein
MLFILHNTEDGLRCEIIERSKFNQWMHDLTDGIKPECHPRFVVQMPTEYSDTNEYLVIDGRIIVPQPVTIVQSYKLD